MHSTDLIHTTVKLLIDGKHIDLDTSSLVLYWPDHLLSYRPIRLPGHDSALLQKLGGLFIAIHINLLVIKCCQILIRGKHFEKRRDDLLIYLLGNLTS